jgi:hypothetical protein
MTAKPAVILAAAALALSTACAGTPPARVRVMSVSDMARIETAQAGARTNVAVFGSGIGQAELALSRRTHDLQIRLHIRALEGFRFDYDDRHVQIEVHQDGTITETGRRGKGAGQALAEGDPLFMPLRHNGDTFEIDSPPDFSRTGPRACRFEWIDFYR